MTDTQRLIDIEERLRIADDHIAIANLMANYSNAADGGWDRPTHDSDAAAALFTEDGEWQGGPYGHARGRAEIKALFARFRVGSPFAFHTNHNPIIEVFGDTAVGEWHHLIFITSSLSAISAASRADVMGTGIYTNDFVRTPDGWRIKTLRAKAIYLAPFLDGWTQAEHLSR